MNVSLLKAIRTVARVDAEPLRLAIFEDIKSRVFLIRLAHWLYGCVKNTRLGTFVVGLYGMKSFFAVTIADTPKHWILSSGVFSNEQKQFDYIEDCVGTEVITRSQFSIGFDSLIALSAVLHHGKVVRKYFRIIDRLKKRYSFMPLCRIASTVGYFLRYQLALQKSPWIKGVLIASNYAPDSVALQTVARTLELPSVYVPHAAVPLRKWMPPLENDLAILDGPAARDIFQSRGVVEGDIIYRGLPGKSYKMAVEKLQPTNMQIGIFLTALTNEAVLLQLLQFVASSLMPLGTILRPHPIQLVSPDFSTDIPRDLNITITSGTPIVEDISRCDLVFLGNSSAHLEVLKAGKPTIYVPQLDGLFDDYYGFVENKIVYQISWPLCLSLNDLINFYTGDWPERFRYYDPTYLTESDLIKAKVRLAIFQLIHLEDTVDTAREGLR